MRAGKQPNPVRLCYDNYWRTVATVLMGFGGVLAYANANERVPSPLRLRVITFPTYKGLSGTNSGPKVGGDRMHRNTSVAQGQNGSVRRPFSAQEAQTLFHLFIGSSGEPPLMYRKESKNDSIDSVIQPNWEIWRLAHDIYNTTIVKLTHFLRLSGLSLDIFRDFFLS